MGRETERYRLAFQLERTVDYRTEGIRRGGGAVNQLKYFRKDF